MKKTTLTKEEFVKRSMAGEVFIYKGDRFFYDKSKDNPFRLNKTALTSYWEYMDGKTIFEIEEPKPILERRWKWRKNEEGYTGESVFVSDNFSKEHKYSEDGWFKVEDLYIDVEVKR